MSRLNEYNVDFGVVFETELEKWWRENMGGGGGGTTTTTPAKPTQSFTESALQDKKDTYANAPGYYKPEQLAAMGGRQLNANTIVTGDGSKYTLDAGTGYYKAFGSANATERGQYGTAPALGSGTTTTPAVTPQALPPGVSAPRTPGVAPGSIGALSPTQTPQLPTLASATIPGYGVSPQGRGYMFTGGGLNDLRTQPQGTGNGPVIQAPPGRAPASMGFGPGVSTNVHTFSQRPGESVEAQKQFESVPVSVPAGYRPGPSGFSLAENGGAFRAFDIPINAGPTGTGLIQMSGPTNMQVGNTGYVTSGGPAVDPFAVYGRQGSADAATRAVQLAQLADERNALFARGYSPQNVIDLLSATREGPPLPEVREYFPGSGALGPAISAASSAMNSAAPHPLAANPASSPLGNVWTNPNYTNQVLGMARAENASTPAAPPATTSPAGYAAIGAQQASSHFPQAAGAGAPVGMSPAEYAAWLEEQEGGAGDRIPGFARGGRVATGPLGGPDQVTNGPILGIDFEAFQRRGEIVPKFAVGEGDANRDGRFDPEMLHVTPIPGYATGGTVSTADLNTSLDSQAVPSQMPAGAADPIMAGYGTSLDALTPGTPNPSGLPPAPPVLTTEAANTVNPGMNGTGAVRTTAPVTSSAPAAATTSAAATTTAAGPLDPIPTMPALTQPVALDSGPELQAMLRAARIAQQQASQNHLRARAGLGGTIGIRTNAQMEGLPPGYYTTPADYSQQIADLQTQLAGLGNISANPNELLAYKNQLEQLLAPLVQAQSILTQIQGLGPVGDPQQITANIVGLEQQLGPLKAVVDAQQSLTALGQPYSQDAIASLSQQVQVTRDNIGYWEAQLNALNEAGADSFTIGNAMNQLAYAQQTAAGLQNQLSQMFQRNNAIDEATNTFNNLLASRGMTWDQVTSQIGGTLTQIETAKQELEKAYRAQELQTEMLQYVPAGTNVSERIGLIEGNMNAAQSAYEGSIRAGELQGQIQAYRNNTDIEGMDINEAPPAVIQQAVVSTPVLKQIAQSDPTSANALAKMDYALSGQGQWTPATSQLLVNLTNSLSGSKAKGSVQALLQSLIAKMPANANVPPALAAAATSGDASKIAAAAKFGQAA